MRWQASSLSSGKFQAHCKMFLKVLGWVLLKNSWSRKKNSGKWQGHRPCPPPPFTHTIRICIMPTAWSFDSALATEIDKGVASLVNLRSGQFWLTKSACFLLTRLMERHKSMGKGILNRWVRGYQRMLLMPIKCFHLQDPNPIGVLN